MNRTIGILGGMGPMATCDLMKKIIEHTDASCDQEHFRICVDSNTNIPDRTAAILGAGEDPRPEMIKSAQRLQAIGAEVLIVPCNTAHYFLDDVSKSVEIPFVHMPRETAKALADRGISAAAILATDGTIQTGIYHRELEKAGITPIQPTEEDQKTLMSLIYDYVKAGKPYPHPEKLLQLQQNLQTQGAQAMILGCTELPIAFAELEVLLPAVDPTDILALSTIRHLGGKTK